MAPRAAAACTQLGVPRAADEDAGLTAGSRFAALPPEGFRVLIVEDNPHIIEMYAYVLKKLAVGELQNKVPLEVQFAPDGHHALKMLLEGRFSLVMTEP